MSERETDMAEAFDHALGLHRAGRHGEALEAYRKVLADYPKHVGALTHCGVVLLEQGKAQEAVEDLQRAVARAPKDAAANAYLANALQVLGRLEDAEAHYCRSLEAAPDDARTLNNFGILLRRADRLQEAEARFRRATELQPDYADALNNLGGVLLAMGRHDAALEAFERALRVNPRDPRAHHARGRCLKALGRPEAAVPAYEKALAIAPDFHEARHNLGVALRLSGRPQEAARCYRAVLRQQPGRPGTQFNLGNALLELGEVEEAMGAYQAAIALRPEHLDAHRALNDLYWQHGRGDDYARSYEDAIRRAPQSVELRQQHAAQLELVGSLAEAEEVVRDALRELGDQPSLSHRLAVLLARRGLAEDAVGHFEAAIGAAPAVALYRQDYAGHLLTCGALDQAGGQLDAWERLAPDDQAMWAYRGLLWRLTGDERAAWLNDYERFVRPIRLEPPASHANLKDFLSDLGEALTALHPRAAHPLEQTLRGGTQTPGELFNKPAPLVQALKGAIETAVAGYIAALPDDPSHPLLRRKTGRFAFSGSWSVRLTSDGFHVDHVHPKGWISSACYIALPEAVKSAGDNDRSGWIRFGRSPLGLGEEDATAKWIRPEEGVLVLFPSYTWHGTEAFATDAVRMTVAFDAVPV
jgi:tetratricopeptide (TPR) repeat protein